MSSRTQNYPHLGFFIVNGFVVKKLGFLDFKRQSVAIEFLKKTAFVSGMAGSGCLFDLEKKDISVAINKPANDPLSVTACLSLEPQFLPRAAPEGH